jgi:molecular chaperone HscB
MQQMELREKLEEAKDSSSLDGLRNVLSGERKNLEKEIAQAIDAEKDYKGAADLVRKLMFLERLGEEIDSAYEAFDQEER